MHGSYDVGEATTAEHMELVIGGWHAKEEGGWHHGFGSTIGMMIDKVGHRGECLRLEC
jgi:hypothetical protein